MPAGGKLWLKPPGGSRSLPLDPPGGGPRADGSRGLRLAAALSAGFFLACWIVYLLAWAGVVPPLAGRFPLALYPLYSTASALGWGAGMVYVQLTRHRPRGERRRPFLLCFFAPPGLLFLLWAMAPSPAQQAAPLVPLYALGVFGILFAVPISMRHVGRGPVEPGGG